MDRLIRVDYFITKLIEDIDTHQFLLVDKKNDNNI